MANRIELITAGGVWVARFLDDPKVVDLFGTDTLPTPYLDTTPSADVLAAIAARNPDAVVYLAAEATV